VNLGEGMGVSEGVGASQSVKGCACWVISGSVQADVRQNEWQ
jgi:hypothetical protein